jgi:Protein of unknown function (DUF2865)
MYRFFFGLTLSMMVLGLVWAAQSMTLGRPGVSSSASETPVQVTTTGEMLVTAEWFELIFSEIRKRSEAELKQRCPTRSRLFVHRNPGENTDDMVDLQGHPYRALPTALLYQTKYVADCTCRGNPWDDAALARHRTYAEDATKKLAGQTAELASPGRHRRGQLQSARRE